MNNSQALSLSVFSAETQPPALGSPSSHYREEVRNLSLLESVPGTNAPRQEPFRWYKRMVWVENVNMGSLIPLAARLVSKPLFLVKEDLLEIVT